MPNASQKNSDGSGFFDGPPDLAVEILSPNDRPGEVMEKVDDYLRAGTIEVWVIDPKQRSITIYTRGAAARALVHGETVADSLALPGFSKAVAAFFE